MKIGQKVTPTGILAARYGLPREEWLGLRMTGIGGSDVGSILGLNKYRSPWGVYLEKRGELPDLPRSERLERAAKWGHLHEENLAAVFCEETGFRVSRVGLIRNQDEPWRLANLDRRVHGCPDGPCFLEEKTRSVYKEHEWGPSGTSEVPDNEALQTYHYMSVTGYRHCHIACLLGGNDDRYYRLDWDDGLIADVNAITATFWHGHVLAGNPPPVEDTEAETELLDYMWRPAEDSVIDLDPAVATALRGRLEDLQGQAKDTEKALAQVKNEIRSALGEYEIGLVNGKPYLTWKRNGVFAPKRFRDAEPEVAAKYTRLVEEIDVEALKTGDPAKYRQYRSRALRTAGSTNRGTK